MTTRRMERSDQGLTGPTRIWGPPHFRDLKLRGQALSLCGVVHTVFENIMKYRGLPPAGAWLAGVEAQPQGTQGGCRTLGVMAAQ